MANCIYKVYQAVLNFFTLTWVRHMHACTELGPAQNFAFYAFEQLHTVLKKLYLLIMPITTAIMPQFIHSFIIINDCISMVSCCVLLHAMLQRFYILHLKLSSVLYAHEKTCGLFCIRLAWLLYHKEKLLYKKWWSDVYIQIDYNNDF